MRIYIVIMLALIALFSVGSAVIPDGVIMPNRESWEKRRERSLINEPDQKAVVFFDNGTEKLIISPSYEGETSNFAWVIPVPSRPKVEILKGAIFHELAKLTAPKPPARESKTLIPAGPAKSMVTVIERKTVGAYDVSVLSATDGKALTKWLANNKYHLPDKALAPIKQYVKEGWTFVATRVKVPGNAKGLSTGTLAPLKLTFRTKNPVYPMRLSAANPKPFSVLIYLILPSSQLKNKPEYIQATTYPSKAPDTARQRAVTTKNQRKYPTLAKLSKESLHIYITNRRILTENCNKDYRWKLPEK